jgi:hypothetical protein
VSAPVELPASSWGSGKDWRVWDGARVSSLVESGREVQRALLDSAAPGPARDPVRDGLARQALLALSSDWAFMVTKDSAADYALARARSHAGSVAEVALAAADGAAAWFDPAELDEADENAFAAWLADAERPKVFHNAKGAMRVFAEHGWRVEGVRMDTALAAYLVKPGRRSFDLDALSLEYLHRELAPAAAADGQLAFGTDEAAEAEALMIQARAVLDLGEAFEGRLEEVGAADLLRDNGVAYVALCAGLGETATLAARAPNGLAAVLEAGQVPEFLTPLPLKDGEQDSLYRVFKVKNR